jgi:hypothetical protein
MRRSFAPLILWTLLVAAAAHAQQAPAPSSPAPDASQTPAPSTDANAASPEGTASATTTTTTQAAPTNARLAAGGVVTGGGSFPLHLQVTLDNFVGNGVLAPGYQAQPNVGTSVNLRPTAVLPRFENMPRMILSMSLDFSVNNWLPAFTNTSVMERQILVGDPSIALILPGIFREEVTGIGVSLVASARAPLSMTSRQQNLVTNVGGAAQFMWASPETPVGTFFVQYTPSVRLAVYSQPAATMPCDVPQPYVTPKPSANPANGVDDLPLVQPRAAELLPSGECILAGRQPMGSINNSTASGWSTTDGTHNVTLALSWSLGFLRPLTSAPELASPFSSGQNFNENSSGSLSYTYTVPTDFPFFITTGVFSSQPVWSANGKTPRFPVWDFFTPANNFSAAFFDVTVGI